MRKLVGGIVAMAIASAVASAELENHVYTSRSDNVRIVVPRGWRESDAPSYPDVLLWMMRGDAKIILTSEPLTHTLYCTWPVQCRANRDLPLTARYACSLRDKLARDHHMHVGLVEAGPKENTDSGVPSVWFEVDDGKHFLRQAVAVADSDDRAFSLVLETSSNAQRAASVRSFEQALRTLRPLSSDELAATPLPVPATVGSDVVPSDAGIVDAATGSAGSAAQLPLVSPKPDPTGPCS
ncbi:MAG TPA: hypothetical protein VGG74_04990 [Kofleriaceae bacterium]|jgi:hypothetical protein